MSFGQPKDKRNRGYSFCLALSAINDGNNYPFSPNPTSPSGPIRNDEIYAELEDVDSSSLLPPKIGDFKSKSSEDLEEKVK